MATHHPHPDRSVRHLSVHKRDVSRLLTIAKLNTTIDVSAAFSRMVSSHPTSLRCVCSRPSRPHGSTVYPITVPPPPATPLSVQTTKRRRLGASIDDLQLSRFLALLHHCLPFLKTAGKAGQGRKEERQSPKEGVGKAAGVRDIGARFRPQIVHRSNLCMCITATRPPQQRRGRRVLTRLGFEANSPGGKENRRVCPVEFFHRCQNHEKVSFD